MTAIPGVGYTRNGNAWTAPGRPSLGITPPVDPSAARADLVTAARTATTRVPRATIEANVGPVDLSVMTVLTGDQTMSTNGQILRDKIVDGRVLSRGTNQLIDNCIIRGGATAPVSLIGLVDCASNSTSGLVVRNTLIEPQTPSLYWGAGIVGARWTCEGVEIRNTTDGVWPRDVQQGATVIPAFDCAAYYLWIHDLAKFWPDPFQSGSAGNGTHNDGVQFFGGSGWTARAFIVDANLDPNVGNTGGLDVSNGGAPIAGKTQGNAAVQLNANSNGTVTMQAAGLDFQYGYFGQGGLGVNGLDADLGGATNLGTISNNDFFARQWFADFPTGTSNRGRVYPGPVLTWTNNIDSEHGTSASVVRATA